MELQQRRSLFGKATFRLADGISVSEMSPLRTVHVTFPFERLALPPVEVRDFPMRWGIASVVLFGLSALALVDGWATRDMGSAFGFWFLMCCAGACAVNVVLLYQNFLLFRGFGSDAVLFVMHRSRPSRADVDAFVSRMTELAAQPRPPFGSSPHEARIFYARALDHMLQAGVLRPEEHAGIRARLFRADASANVVKLVP